MESVRVDKWLWAVRLFKTRGLAARACESGRVKEGRRVLKASTPLRGGEVIELPFPQGPGTRVVRVRQLIEKRVGAALAGDSCEELTPAEVLESRRRWLEDRQQRQEGDQGRPTKRRRRRMDDGFFE